MPTSATRNILVTGATGFIGGHVAMRLVEEGWRVKLLVRDAGRLLPPLRQADIIVGGLNGADALAHAVRDVQVVIHCAANVHTWDSLENYRAANVAGTANLLQAVITEGAPLERFVHISTADVYGFPVGPADETTPVSPSGFGYGDSKIEGEAVVRSLCGDHAVPYTILRPCNVYGPRGQFIERVGDALQSGPMIAIDHGRANAGLVYIDNLVDHILWAAQADAARGETFNVRDAYDVSWARFMDVFKKSLPRRGLMIDLPFGIANAVGWVCEAAFRVLPKSIEPPLHRLLVRIFGRTCGHDAGKIHRVAALPGQVGFETAMARSVAWYLDRKKQP